MKNKFLSVIIVPHNKTSCRTITFSKRSLRNLVGGIGVFLAVLFIFLIDYFSMGTVRYRYDKLVKETEGQRARLMQYENSIKSLQATISAFESYTKKLNVMAGLKSPEALTKPAGVGGGPEDGSFDPVDAPEQQQLAPATSSPQVLSPAMMNNLNLKAESINRNLNSLVGYFESQGIRLSSTPSIMPANGWLSSRFGMRVDPFTGRMTRHAGIDISTNTGNPIVSPADGIVISATTDRFYGKNVIISHGFGVTTLYGHLSAFGVKVGQKVRRGMVIGNVGQTGKAVGPHLHYEVRVNGKAVNPLNYVLEE